jgi:uncharacterized membrane protein
MRLRFKLPIFWISVGLVIAVVVHLSYVLFTPSRAMDAKFTRTVAKSGINALAVLSPAEARSLTGLSTAGSIYAACPYNLRNGDLTINAEFPARPWTLSVYGISGARLFSVNDKQAGVDKVTLEVKRGGNIWDVLTDHAPPEIGDGWSVEVKERRGIAVLWMADADPVVSERLKAELARSKCIVAPRPEPVVAPDVTPEVAPEIDPDQITPPEPDPNEEGVEG